MSEGTFSHLRNKSNRTKRRIEKSRRWKIRNSLMRNQGLSKDAAKELAAGYKFERKTSPGIEQ